MEALSRVLAAFRWDSVVSLAMAPNMIEAINRDQPHSDLQKPSALRCTVSLFSIFIYLLLFILLFIVYSPAAVDQYKLDKVLNI